MHKNKEEKRTARILWLSVIAAFLVLIAAWSFLIYVAENNEPQRIESPNP